VRYLQELQEEIHRQQAVISQASQALSLCRSTAEFHGSTEQVEGERLLLIATYKRQACLNVIQRLKTEGGMADTVRSQMSPGTLSISNISLPVKQAFLRQTNHGTTGDYVHFFLLMVRHGSQVITTQMVSTQDAIASDGAFHYTNMITIHDLAPDFTVLVEVYGLQTFRHRVDKPGRKGLKEKGTLRLTPRKKSSRTDMRMVATQSPGGPNAVLTSSFGLIGYQQITNRNTAKKAWQLDKVPHESPLEGTIDMRVQCHTDFSLEEKGFLTMFEDISGFGAWHRRWFVLNTSHLTYWKYPDDEKRKEPMGEVDLRQCITDTIGLVPRDVCARPNTFMLVTARQPSNGDRSSLIMESYNTYTATRHLLSADTKEERILWCQRLNLVLSNLRVWDPEALKPPVNTQ